MVQTLGSHSQTGLSGVTDGEWVHFDILKAGEDGGDDRYRLLNDLTRPPRSNPFNAPRPTLPPADKVSNLLADGLSQALSSEGIDHSTESRDLEAVDFGEEVTVEDRWVEVDRLPERAWKTILKQGMDVLRSAVKERTTFNETAAELKDTSISSLSELANEYGEFFKSGIVSYSKKKQPTNNGKIQRTLIVRVRDWGTMPSENDRERRPANANLLVRVVPRGRLKWAGSVENARLIRVNGADFYYNAPAPLIQASRLSKRDLVQYAKPLVGNDNENDDNSENDDDEGGLSLAGLNTALLTAAVSLTGYFISQD